MKPQELATAVLRNRSKLAVALLAKKTEADLMKLIGQLKKEYLMTLYWSAKEGMKETQVNVL